MSLPAQLFSLKGSSLNLGLTQFAVSWDRCSILVTSSHLLREIDSQGGRSAQQTMGSWAMWEYRMVSKREYCHFRSVKLLTSLRSCVRLLFCRAHVCRSFNKLGKGAPFSSSSGFRWHLKQAERILLSSEQWTSATNLQDTACQASWLVV